MIVNIFESGKEALLKWYQHKPLNSRNWKDIVKKWKKSAKIGEFCKSDQVTLSQVNPQGNLWIAAWINRTLRVESLMISNSYY